MLVCLLVEVDMVSVFPYYLLEKEKKNILDIKCHESYLMKCLHIILPKTIQYGDTGLTTSSFER